MKPPTLSRVLAALAVVLVLAVILGWTHRQRFLVHAAVRGEPSMLRVMVAIGADPNSASTGSLSLYAAAWHGHPEAVECLVALGANVDAPDPSGYTPLIAAASQGHDAVVETLLRLGAAPSSRGPCGTALDVARANGHASTIALLSSDRGAASEPRKE